MTTPRSPRRAARRILLSAPLLALACATGLAAIDAADETREVETWRAQRYERLRNPNGWLSLAGLFWLKEGDNALGSAEGTPVKLPADRAPARAGAIRFEKGQATLVPAPDAGLQVDGKPVTVSTPLADDDPGPPSQVDVGRVNFILIERSGRIGVRLRDPGTELLKSFSGIEHWPVDVAWRFAARFEPAPTPRTIPVPNVLGFDENIANPGTVVLTIDGKEYRLTALDDTGDGRLFLVFGDRTNGKETYGGGRFLYTDPPVDGKVIVDFNRAYNPPCVFSHYATCPLPPPGNKLPLPILAGEKKFVAPHAS
jgi:uncharacterized protein (DUF1684 family)